MSMVVGVVRLNIGSKLVKKVQAYTAQQTEISYTFAYYLYIDAFASIFLNSGDFLKTMSGLSRARMALMRHI